MVSRNETGCAAESAERAHGACGHGPPAGSLGGATPAPRSSPSRISVVCSAALLAVAACEPYVEGNGVYREEDRTASVGSFVGIHVDDRIVATVTSHAADYKVTASGDSNVLQYIQTEVREETILGEQRRILHVLVNLSAGYSSRNPSAVVVQAPEILYAYAVHDAQVDVTGAATPIFSAGAESGANVSIVGPHASDPEGDPAGSSIQVSASNGTVDAHRYVTTDSTEAARVELGPGARVQLHADGPVAGTASAGSSLYNAGSGSCASVQVTGGNAAIDCPP